MLSSAPPRSPFAAFAAGVPMQPQSPAFAPPIYRHPKRRRGSESDSQTDTDLDEAFVAATLGATTADNEHGPSPKRRREGTLVDRGLSKLSLAHAAPREPRPDSPTLSEVDDDDDDVAIDADDERDAHLSVLHPLVAEHLRLRERLVPPLPPDPHAGNALVLYQPVLRTVVRPDEVEEASSSSGGEGGADDDDDGAPFAWPGKRTRRRHSNAETIEVDPDWPVEPAQRVGSTPTSAVFAEDDGDDGMDVDEGL